MHATVRNLVLFSVFILTYQFKTPLARGFSFDAQTQTNKTAYIQKARDLKLWEDGKWIRLWHYENTLFGFESSFRGPLFIDDVGYKSPEKELLTTLDVFFSDSPELTSKFKRHPQCQFLARRHWLNEKLGFAKSDLLPCEERRTWKANLNVKAVSIVFAASDLGNPASSFGHTFLKMVNPQNSRNKDLIDYGVNYAATADDSEGLFYALKGLLGMYGGIFTMLPYHQKIREYINIEGRDIWEYPLSFSEAEVDFLVDHLLEMEGSSAPYYFFTGNCSYHILRTLEVVRPELQFGTVLTAFVIPIDTIKVVERHSSLIKERYFKKSLKTDYLESYSQLDLLQKKVLDDAVEKLKIPTTYPLSPVEKAEVYETAMKYTAIKAYRTGKDLDEDVYTLSTERSLLGSITSDREIRFTQPPDLSHDSSALYFGVGQQSAAADNNLAYQSYYSLKFRSAFHDLEQPDFGSVHLSQTELGGIDLRYYNVSQKLSLHRFTLLNLINTNPVTQLDRNISWKVRGEIFDQWVSDFEAGGGMSFDFNLGEATRLSYFLTGRYWHNDDLDYIFAGPEILFVTRPTTAIGFSTSIAYLGVVNHDAFLRVKSKINFNLKQNYDIQLEAENLYNKQIDTQLRFVKNFLF